MKKFKSFILGIALITSFVFPATVNAATVQEKIAGLYIAFFNRAADKSGLEYWENQASTLGEDIAINALAKGFSAHPKFTSLYSGMSNKEFVEAIYLNVLGQAGDSEGVTYWSGLLNNGMSRSDMVAQFVTITLDFNRDDPQYASLEGVISSDDKRLSILDTAQQRKDLFTNKVAISLKFIDVLKDETNLDPSTDASNPDALDMDKTYRASINILHGITYDNTTKDRALSILDSLSQTPTYAIDIINRLKEQFGSVLQDDLTVNLIKSLLQNLKEYNSNFGTIISPVTGRVWMDRNLGASQVCTSPSDDKCYGDYYQWGRYPDGHEKSNSATTLKVASSYIPDDGKYVISAYDWTDADVNGEYRSQTYNVCPVGFRVPSIEELLAEHLTSRDNAFANLKLPIAGERDRYGHFKDRGSDGYLLSTTSVVANNYKLLKYTSSYSTYNLSGRTTGVSVRCIKIVEPIKWVAGEWGTCQGKCGISYGIQTRSVTCQDANGNILSDSYCIDIKPQTTQICTTKACDGNLAPVAVDDKSGENKKSLNVGYYDMELGKGNSDQISTIEDANLSDIDILDLNVSELDSIDILYVQNPSNLRYGSEYLSKLSDIYDFVNKGKVLIIHDRYVAGAANILPGGSSIVFHRIAGNGEEIEIIDDDLETGIGGDIDDDSLDGGNLSNHGYAELYSLPLGSKVLMTDGDPTHVVTFSYPYGTGMVIYSTIPLDFYLVQATYNYFQTLVTNMKIYATNLLEDVSLQRSIIFVCGDINEANEINPTISSVGNVLNNDYDPDTPHSQLTVMSVDSTAVSNIGDTNINGLYGTLSIDSDGNFTYNLDNNNLVVNALSDGEDINETFTYIISDNESEAKTDSATLTITIKGANDAPIADAGADQNITLGDTVTLDGSSSSDVENDTLTYLWTIVSKPAGSTATLSDATVVSPTFVVDSLGDYNITLVVNDGMADSETDSVLVRVLDTTPPLFTSSDTASVNENQTDAITLVATDISPVTYSISGGDADSFNINSTSGVVTFKVAPDYEMKDTYTFTAKATDSYGNETTQNITVYILNLPDQPGDIEHNGVIYNIVVSPTTNRVWLDRNLGAKRVCQDTNDTSCYGDYYQWGRGTDGHEKFDSTTTQAYETDLELTSSNFVTNTDWTELDENGDLREAIWSKTDGTSICPNGYRVPTIDELSAELNNTTNATDAFGTFLKLPTAGERLFSDGTIIKFDYGMLWSSSIDINGDIDYREYWSFSPYGSSYGSTSRGYGFSIRCIKAETLVRLPILKTGQTTIFVSNDDGALQRGKTRQFARDDNNETVTDSVSNLMWQDDSDRGDGSAVMDWNSANAYCENLVFAGYDDWRLPTTKELNSIIDRSRYNPCIDSSFHNVVASHYWSSETAVSDDTQAWFVSFYIGYEDWAIKNGANALIRCVRSISQ